VNNVFGPVFYHTTAGAAVAAAKIECLATQVSGLLNAPLISRPAMLSLQQQVHPGAAHEKQSML